MMAYSFCWDNCFPDKVTTSTVKKKALAVLFICMLAWWRQSYVNTPACVFQSPLSPQSQC